MAIIYSVSNHKGGVGKTTSTINIGAGLTQYNKKVLLIDLDPQENLTQSLNIKNSEFTIYEYLKGAKPINPIEIRPNLYVIPSSLDLSAAEIELNAEPGREYVLSEILNTIRDEYDYILIDCPPSLASDKVIIPLQAEFLPLKGLSKLNDVIKKIKSRLNKNLDIGCVFFNQFDSRKVLNRDVSESVKRFFIDKVMETKISNNIALAEAPSQGKDIFWYNKTCKGAQDYRALCDEMIEKKVA
jgi:chromosome partitioning protein